MTSTTSIPKGTRDFLPQESIRRNYIFDTIRSVFRLYGYQPIETPAMENLSTLLGKYGEEGDKLLFRILNSGDFLSGVTDQDLADKNINTLASQFCEKGLRYDLTVPFARFVVQHRNEITFPFKRYQIQPVWRADRPQKGRYREFFQCDVDVIGSDSLLNEVELIQIIDDVFTRLGIRVQVQVNNRKVLTGIAEVLGIGDQIIPFTVAIDKLEKIGTGGVLTELQHIGLTEEFIRQLVPILELRSENDEVLVALEHLVRTSITGLKGIQELRTVFENLKHLHLSSEVIMGPSLARGLNYYTGAIIEVRALDVQLGSLCGGGRYDNLTGVFGMPDISGVGVSFGAERIYDVLAELGGFPPTLINTTKVMFVNFGGKEAQHCLKLMQELREAGISTELYPDVVKIKKQFSYADARKIPYVAIIGEEEMKSGQINLKNMKTGEQALTDLKDLTGLKDR
ncbi:MAG: histidine--tRNA ligase [Bacteroidales bacterium]|nr:histidine--tRNA ligase [Bacteroidales bacterium]MDZ4205027.1 histidine--tRNA ligase [Bacteroidales bacterium]